MADRQARDVDGANEQWARTPWARTFGLIQARYGWSDQHVLDLTPARLRQLQSVVLAERREEHLQQVRLVELQTRTLVAHTRAAAGDKKADKAAASVRFTSERVSGRPGPRQLPSTEALTQRFGWAPGMGPGKEG